MTQGSKPDGFSKSALSRKLRELGLLLMVAMAMALVLLFAWMTRQPSHPFFERVTGVPILGFVVEEVRRPHLEAQVAAQAATSDTDSSSGSDNGRAFSRPQPPEDSDFEWIGIGAKLYPERGPSSGGTSTTSLASYEVLERDGQWLRLKLFDGREAWVDRSEPRDFTPPLGNAPTPPGPLLSRPVAPERLKLALASMEGAPSEISLDGYRAFTDLGAGSELLHQLESALVEIEAQYKKSYGLTPLGSPKETIALYRTAAGYRGLQTSTKGIDSVVSTGHASGGLVALAVGRRANWEVESTLVHEVTHLLNRRALGPVLPPWLSEGLATHMGQLGRRENPEADSRFVNIGEEEILYRGPLASLKVLAERASRGSLLELEGLTSVQEDQFKGSPSAALLYAEAAFLVDYLLSQQAFRDRFRAFLAGVASGESASGERLRRELGVSWQVLDAGFSEWLQARSERALDGG